MALITRLAGRLLRWRQVAPDSAEQPDKSVPERTAPTSPGALTDFEHGTSLYEARRYEHAVERFEAALAARHDWADAHYNLGLALYQLRRLEEAGDAFSMAQYFAPDMLEAYVGLAHAENEQGKVAEALATIDSLLRLEANNAGAHNLKGTLLLSKADVTGALASFENAVAADPQGALGHSNLGYVLFRELGEFERGAYHIERALQLDPENEDILCNHTMVLAHCGEDEQAIALCGRLLVNVPEMHEARLNRALALLKLGRFDQAWDDYEARKITRSNYVARAFPCPEWRGEDLRGKTILIYGEQGLGDEIMFASCFDEIIRLVGRCVIECSPRLGSLFQNSFPNASVVAGNQSAALPKWWAREAAIDYQVAAGSLPRYLRRSPADFPSHNGYLSPDEARIARWRGQLASLGPGLKVGISWRGGKPSTRSNLRSLDLGAFAPLMRTQSAHFVDLQYGDTADERTKFAREYGLNLHSWREAIDDLHETAALIRALDLVISVCTAVVHLAGAIGRPVWVLVPASPEWRYLAKGSAMPWYPTARLYRQRVHGDWRPVLDEIVADFNRLFLRSGGDTDIGDAARRAKG
jgi:tetratricopeptide (TPR) repeat protein